MSDKQEILQNLLSKKFNLEEYKNFINRFFYKIENKNGSKSQAIEKQFSDYISSFTEIAKYKDEKNNSISFMVVEIKKEKSVERARNMQRNYMAKFLDKNEYSASIVAFHNEEEENWRLSFVRLDYSFSEKGILKEITPAKRYSYLVGKDEPNHTAKKQFYTNLSNLQKNPNVDELEKMFEIENVTKDFFEKYKEKYFELKEYLDKNDDFIETAKKYGFTTEEFSKKLMGQIAFLYFLQKKGWLGVKIIPRIISIDEFKKIWNEKKLEKEREILKKSFINADNNMLKLSVSIIENLNNEDADILASCFSNTKYEDKWGEGNKKFIRYLFESCEKKSTDNNFFHDWLEPLFYTALNQKRGNNQYFKKFNCKIPFLNGGLFEHMYGKEGWEKNNFHIPNEIFSNKSEENEGNGILDIFDIYNFTINEDEPLEKEVAVDPEMLGKIFENLLDVKDRKSKGAFYTPREIVHYMCKESLINYLISETEIEHQDLDNFIQLGEFIKDEDKRAIKDKKTDYLMPKSIIDKLDRVDKALENVKVADPAVGSGAFPLGMLNEIVKARDTLTEYYLIGKNSFECDNIRYERSMYNLKKNAMMNSIHAVDIEPSAVDITKLRLWLSIIVDNDEEIIHELPNLDYKIMTGNSLIEEFEGMKLFDERLIEKDIKNIKLGENNQNIYTLFGNKREDILKKVVELRERYFKEKIKENKDKLRTDIEKYEWMLIKATLTEHGKQDKIKELEKLNKEKRKPYFLWKWNFLDVFEEKGGFDIVIGNPPYVSTKGIGIEFKKLLEKEYNFADDMYNHFYFKGLDLLKKNGVLVYITPKTFWTTQTKRNLRDLLFSNRINYIFDTASPFEAAMVDTCVISVSKINEQNNVIHFLDGSKDLANPLKYEVKQEVYLNTQNSVIFKPTEENMKIFNLYGHKVKELYNQWWDKISTSKNIEKNKTALEDYRKNLKPGDIALLGCLTEGGQGLATANNGKYIAVRKSTKWAKNILESRPKKLAEAIKSKKIKIAELEKFGNTTDYLNSLTETEIAELFDSLKQQYGRDIFGQGYIYRLVEDSEIADVDTLTEDEKQNGIDKNKNYYVPYDKGDKDGNRWYLETPFAIAWHKENVEFLKTNSGKKGEGMPVVRNPQYYFKEGFCWTNVLTTYIKCRMKQKTIHSTESMSFFSVVESIPEFYMISIMNSRLIAFYIDSFVNSTSHCTTGDAKLIPLLIPTQKQLDKVKRIFDEAITIKRKEDVYSISKKEAEQKLLELQTQLDKMVYELYELTEEEIKIVEG